MKNNTNNPSRTYSPFCGVTVVFLTFIVLQGIGVKNVFQQRENLQSTRAELQKILPQAQTINQTVENLGRDLLSMTNKEARQIIADFKIAPNTR